MYRALIVDDEPAARETLKCLIDWGKVGFAPPVCAANGQAAWALYQQSCFDVVFTDIEMPLMNGLELIEKIHTLRPQQKIVIISCHESFQYARRAMQLGVEDYLIKDLISESDLYVNMLNLRAQLEEQKDYPKVENRRDINDIIERMITEGDNLTPEERKMTEERMGLTSKQAIAAILMIVDSYEQLRKQKPQETNLWHQNLAEFSARLQNNSLAVVGIHEGEYLLIFNAGDSFSTLNFINHAIQYANHLRTLAQEQHIASVSIGISNFSGKLAEIPLLYAQAAKACEMRVVAGFNKNFLHHGSTATRQPFEKSALDQSVHEIKTLLFERDTKCLKLVRRLYSSDLMDGFMELNYYRYLNIRLYGTALNYIDQNALEDSTLFLEDWLDIERIIQLETATQMADCFCAIFEKLLDYQSKPAKKEDNLAVQAKLYIEKNYDKNISLGEIAELLHVHKGYLCRMFKEETGENLTQYVVSCKMEKAKEMLASTSLMLYEISDQLGFATPQYFSLVFKRQTGVTPNEYKKQR